MRNARRGLAGALFALLVAGAAASSASAASVTVERGRLKLTAGAQERNVVTLEQEAVIPPGRDCVVPDLINGWDCWQSALTVVTVIDDGATLIASGDCTSLDEHRATCVADAWDAPHVRLGDGDDSATLSMRAVVWGEAGNDRLQGSPAHEDLLMGGDGDDHVVGGPGRDSMYGGGGNDRVDSHDGERDLSISCGDGIDTLIADTADTRPVDCED